MPRLDGTTTEQTIDQLTGLQIFNLAANPEPSAFEREPQLYCTM